MNLMKDLIEQVDFWSYYITCNEHEQFELQTEAQNRIDELRAIALPAAGGATTVEGEFIMLNRPPDKAIYSSIRKAKSKGWTYNEWYNKIYRFIDRFQFGIDEDGYNATLKSYFRYCWGFC